MMLSIQRFVNYDGKDVKIDFVRVYVDEDVVRGTDERGEGSTAVDTNYL